ncbi:MAG: hypothetical protein L3J89_14935 [Gammaproteobacteria bacterium]|nr:hypothetical protein [Gammaproteobacteria bacterium]
MTSAVLNNYLLEADNLEALYDENDQLKASYLRGVVIGEIINGFERDTSGKLKNHSYHHDQVNSVVVLTDHTGATVQTRAYTHDELGNILTATDRNGAVVRTRYDSLNRVIQAEYLSDFTTQTAQYNQCRNKIYL